jgi:hypothetical protein
LPDQVRSKVTSRPSGVRVRAISGFSFFLAALGRRSKMITCPDIGFSPANISGIGVTRLPDPYLNRFLLQGRLAVRSDECPEDEDACFVAAVPVIGDGSTAEVRDQQNLEQPPDWRMSQD